MNQQPSNMHFVCTPSEARELIDHQEHHWVTNCGCRESRGLVCSRSKLDVCLQFVPQAASGGQELREISRLEARALADYAQEKGLVCRPFRDPQTFQQVEGICFCCDDCCAYFLRPEEEPCDQGSLTECTDMALCDDCGICLDSCHFQARQMVEGSLALNKERCYGCGLCVGSCPREAIRMVPR
jgi:electron transport complex protein RnfB